MTRPFRFAVQGGPWDDADAFAGFAQRVEQLGYDELYTADHIGATDPFIPLVVAAGATTTLRVGPLVLNNEFHQPVLLARTAATVDRLNGGRLVLGIGTGYAEAEHDAIGSPILPPGPRVTRLGESLTVLRSLLDDGAARHVGNHVTVDLDDLGVRPRQEHVPFLIGGNGRRVVGLGARHADIFQFTGMTHGEGGALSAGGFAVDDVAERARWLTEAAGDRDDRIERSALVQVTAIGSDVPSIEEQAQRFGREPEVVEHTPFTLIGSLEQVIDKIERIRNVLGVSHFVIREPDAFAPVVERLAGR